MNTLTVCLEHRFYSCGSRIYTKLAFAYSYWLDYLQFFDKIVIVARVQKVDAVEQEMKEVDGAGVAVWPMPYYQGPRQFIKKLPFLFFESWRVAKSQNQFLLRSGNVSNLLWAFLILLRKPYLREYPGNIKEGIKGFVGDSLRVRMLASVLDSFAKIQGKYSRANSFVSEDCRKIYESSRPGYVFSSFRAAEISVRKWSYTSSCGFVKILSVGRLEGEKGHASLIEAASIVGARYSVKLILVGDGSKKNQLMELSEQKGVDVEFTGAILNRSVLFSLMADADIFVLPSHTEGMPRALLEAMAVGLPCIGSRVGGIPEVLPEEALFSPADINDLASALINLAGDDCLRRRLGQENVIRVESNYSEEMMRKKKHDFWGHLHG